MIERKFKISEAGKNNLLNKFPELTQADLIHEVGREEELLIRLQKKLKKNKSELRGWLSLMG